MKKKFVSLLIAFIMAFAISMPVMAYDAALPEPPAHQWEVFQAFHWVVRGDTVESIAQLWGTTPELIRANNAAYFADLALRNQTYGLNIQLEPGVRLYIYHMLRLTYWVNRFTPVPGVTLADIANGAFITPWGYPLVVPQERIIAENRVWFDQLNALNRMRSSAPYTLEESFHMLNVTYYDLLESRYLGHWWNNMVGTPIANAAPINSANWPAWGAWTGSPLPFPGSPLVITVPVAHIHIDSPPIPTPFSTVTFLRSTAESIPTLHYVVEYGMPLPYVGWQLTTFNPWPTNPLLMGHRVGMWRAVNPLEPFFGFCNLVQLEIPGLFG